MGLFDKFLQKKKGETRNLMPSWKVCMSIQRTIIKMKPWLILRSLKTHLESFSQKVL